MTEERVGYFGDYGGRFVPETLIPALQELEAAYAEARADPAFQAELQWFAREYGGRPSPLYRANRLTDLVAGATIWLKREDLIHGGAHKFNNVMGQALLAKRMGKTRIIAETGAGQHGTATAMVCAALGLPCKIYMGAVDIRRQAQNVFRMKLMGAEVEAVHSGSRTLKDAINEALRDWVSSVRDTHYIIGSVVGPHPFPYLVRDLQRVIGDEIKAQLRKHANKLPDAVVACVGGGSNAIGAFFPFLEDTGVALHGAEAGGKGLDTGVHSATLIAGRPGVLHGARMYLLQDDEGQVHETHSISAGLDYPGVGPEHSWLKDTGRATYHAVTDDQALAAFKLLSEIEGIIPALESAHAISLGMELAKELGAGKDVVINLSGRGDKDLDTVARLLGIDLGIPEEI